MKALIQRLSSIWLHENSKVIYLLINIKTPLKILF